MIEEFYEFLDQRGLVETFEGYRMNPLSDVSPKLYLYSIDWQDTTEGSVFWSEINLSWNAYLAYWEEDLGKEWYLKEEYNGH